MLDRMGDLFDSLESGKKPPKIRRGDTWIDTSVSPYVERTYPDTPGHRGIDTSVDAAEAMKPTKSRLQDDVLKELANSPATSFQLADRMGISYAAIQPRTTELRILGKIIDSGQRHKGDNGRSSIVWRIV